MTLWFSLTGTVSASWTEKTSGLNDVLNQYQQTALMITIIKKKGLDENVRQSVLILTLDVSIAWLIDRCLSKALALQYIKRSL